MASGIKIINILKGDHFEEVFEEFKKANAEEVILIFPKNSHIAKSEAHFVSLSTEAESSGKTITVMTADNKVRGYSQKYGFKFLASPGRGSDDEEMEAEEEKPKKIEEPSDEDLEVEELETDMVDEKAEDVIEEEKTEDVEEVEKDDVIEEETVPEGMIVEDDKEVEDTEEEETIEEDFEDDGAHATGVASLAMAKFKAGHTPAKKSKSAEKASAKKLENLENMWFKGEKEQAQESSSTGIWSNKKIFRRPKTSPKANLLFLGGAVIVLGAVFYFFLGNAQVVLKPQKQTLDFELKISTSSDYSEIDPKTNRIPGQLLTYKEEVTQDFSSTGQKEVAQKSRGEITVYNNYNTEQQTFIATTRFESSTGLIFRIPRPVTIPGAKTVGGKLIPGSATVEVLADKAGPEYNIAPGRFTVPGLKGSPKYDGFYAESAKAFSGGVVGLSKIVTENDFAVAKEEVTKKALEGSASKLKSKANNLKIIDPLDNKITSLQATAEAEQAVDGFAVKAIAEAKTVGFSEEDILELIRAYVSKDQEMILLQNSLRLEYKNVKTDFAHNLLTFNVAIQGEAAAKIDEEKIVGSMLGMKQGNIKDYLLSIREIESAKVILSPFWVKVVPKNRKDVKVELMY
ncbi:MAG: hypothetical protein Q7S32_02360 [bacterium]|nr:hypothetical protein [bacterium]